MIQGPAIPSHIRYLKPDFPRDELPQIGAPGYPTEAVTCLEPVEVIDARPANERGELSLETNGFVLVREPTKCPNFRHTPTVRETYYPEVTALVKRLTGAPFAVTAEPHILRTDTPSHHPDLLADAHGDKHSAPIFFVHLDVSDAWARRNPSTFERRAKLPVEKGGLGGSPIPPERKGDYDYVTYNLWRPFEGAALRDPLALLDARTVTNEDTQPSMQGYGKPLSARSVTKIMNAEILSGTMLRQSPQHRWHYFSQVQPEEIIVFLGHKHPRGPGNHAPGSGLQCPHMAIVDPTAAPDAPPRRSVETRVVAAFPKQQVSAKL